MKIPATCLIVLSVLWNVAFAQEPAADTAADTAPDAPASLDDRMYALMVKVDGNWWSFEMTKYEVTNALWAEVMGEALASDHPCPNCPKTEVNHADIDRFVEALNARLSKPVRLMGQDEFSIAVAETNQVTRYGVRSELKASVWFKTNSRRKLHPVGQKEPNDAGIYDLMGNAGEWTHETIDSMRTVNADDPDGPPQWIVYDPPMGSVSGGSVRDSWRVFEAARVSLHPLDTRDPFIGFRLVRNAKWGG